MSFSGFGAGFFAARLVIFCMCRGLFLFVLVLTVVGQATHVENGTTFDGPGGKLYYEVIGSRSAVIVSDRVDECCDHYCIGYSVA